PPRPRPLRYRDRTAGIHTPRGRPPLAPFLRPGPFHAYPWRARRRRLRGTHANSIPGHPAGARRTRSVRHRTNRHRQDRRVRITNPRTSRRRSTTSRTAHLPRPRAEPDAGVGEPDRGQLSRLWRGDATVDGGGVRRRPDRIAAAETIGRRRHPRCHTGTLARSDRHPFANPVERTGSSSRRGRSDAPPRLHPCVEAHREAVAATAANVAVLGDDAATDRSPGRRLSQ